VQPLLDAVVDFLPSPLDVPPVVGHDPETERPIHRRADPNEPLTALAFKIAADPNVERVVYARIYAGTLKTQSVAWNPRIRKRERISRVLRVHANRREVIEQATAGDIVMLIGPRETATGDTLCSPDAPVVLESLHVPEPVLSVAVEPRNERDKDALENAIRILQDEDPTVRAGFDPETGQRILSGMGELHLEILVERMAREFKVEARVGQPQVAYKETITARATAVGRYERHTDETGLFGEVRVCVEPMHRGLGVEVRDEIPDGVLPPAMREAALIGVRSALNSGVIAGFPLVDVRVRLLGGTMQEKFSQPIAFEAAGTIAVQNALREARPVLLEPMMYAQIVVPREHLGKVLGDLNARRVHIHSVESRGDMEIINADVPLATMFQYTTALRSLTQGRGSHTLEFKRYETVPESVAVQLNLHPPR